jgi:DNA-binding IclR family transcriptional regulator
MVSTLLSAGRADVNIDARSDGTVGKALDLLDLVARSPVPLRFSDIQPQSPHPKATLHRLLQTLVSQGMLSYDHDAHTYSLGLRLVQLAHKAWSQSSLAPHARPFVDALARRTGETIHLAQMVSGQVLYIDKRNARDPVEMFSQAGKVGPGYCTGVGKAILAFQSEAEQSLAIAQQSFHRYTENTLPDAAALSAELAEIRKAGISFDREEHEPGIICIAAPILSSRDNVLGALSVTTTTARHCLDELLEWKPALTDTAAKIAQAAEAWRFPAQTS